RRPRRATKAVVSLGSRARTSRLRASISGPSSRSTASWSSWRRSARRCSASSTLRARSVSSARSCCGSRAFSARRAALARGGAGGGGGVAGVGAGGGGLGGPARLGEPVGLLVVVAGAEQPLGARRPVGLERGGSLLGARGVGRAAEEGVEAGQRPRRHGRARLQLERGFEVADGAVDVEQPVLVDRGQLLVKPGLLGGRGRGLDLAVEELGDERP